MEIIHQFLNIFLHLDQQLPLWASQLGIWLYIVLFLIIFCETGLVVTPFLPGDSLLFAIGALTALPDSPIHLTGILALLLIAAILGDATNYMIGYRIGPKIFSKQDSIFLNKDHLLKAQAFYEKHGGKTIILARFMPIIRTFAPFVAGIGKMNYGRFALFNVSGGVAWVSSFVLAGYWFGNQEIIKRNFHIVILAIIFLSILPGIIEYWRHRKS
ncbi:MAG: DedA family protein [Deltaproteobacteria bacterium]|nr:MAG: DedA family protein [Deltaproteobacteria bacterium]